MNYTELSLAKLKKICLSAAREIAVEESVDLIIYVAKAGYPIAKYMNSVFQVPLVGIEATRKGNKLKSALGPLFTFLPSGIRKNLVRLELNLNVHKRMDKRNPFFHERINEIDKTAKNILLVDDSVDTGNTLKNCYDLISVHFPEANIITYSLNIWEKSSKIIQTDYYSYTNTVIKAPMSKDSKEYVSFIKMYQKETDSGRI